MKQKSYYHQHKKRLIKSWKEYGKIIKSLAKKVEDNFAPDCIVGNSKGGCIIGGTIAVILRKDFYPVRISRRIKDEIVFTKPKVTVIPSVDLSGKKILLVDDIAVFGETIKIVVKLLKKEETKRNKNLNSGKAQKFFYAGFLRINFRLLYCFPLG